MANIFTQNPIFIDTDTTTGAGTNWRGTSGGAQLNPGNLPTNAQQLSGAVSRQWGIRPVAILVGLTAGGTAAVAGNVVVSDPQTTGGAGQLLTIPITTTFTTLFMNQEDLGDALWRDFIVTGATAAKVCLQIWYRA